MKKFLFACGIISSVFLFSCKEIQPVTVSRAEGAKIDKMDMKGIEAEIMLRVKNPNKMGFNIYPTDLDITLNNMNMGKARLKKRVHIKGNADEVYTFHLEATSSDLISGGIATIMALAQKRSITLGAKGDLKVGKIFYKKTFPVDVKEKVPLSQ